MTASVNQPEGARQAGESGGAGLGEAGSGPGPADGRPTRTPGEPGADARVRVAVILSNDGESPSVYEMFEATEMNSEGAFLAGELFLEVGELVTLQLAVEGQDPIRAQARVVGLERGNRSGMAVAFQELGEDEVRALQRLAVRVSGG